MPYRCLVCVLCSILLSFVAAAGLAVLTVWLVFRPSHLKVHVDAAALTRFNLSTPSNHLSFNLSLDVSIRSPNERLAIYYDSVEAAAFYAGYQFGRDDGLPCFFQDVKNTTVIHPKFEGRREMVAAETTYRREGEEGWFHVEVKVYTRVRFKAWFVKTNRYKPKFTCDLKLPAPDDPPGGKGTFNRTRCDVDIF